MGSLNFGIGGDSTQHVFWRIQNGELENINPKVGVYIYYYFLRFEDQKAQNITLHGYIHREPVENSEL